MKRFFANPVGLSILLAIPVLGFCWYISVQHEDDSQFPISDSRIPRNRSVQIGGIERAVTDVSPVRIGKSNKPAPNENLHHGLDIKADLGKVTCPKTPRLVRGENPQMDSVIEALETKMYPERLSPLVPSTKFDCDAWRQDNSVFRGVSGASEPLATTRTDARKTRLVSLSKESPYLNTSEPGRVYDVAEPGEGVKVLKNLSDPRVEITEGESVYLRVETEPFAPASFTAFSVGKFKNGLMAITAVADKNGIVEVSFTGTTGPSNVAILAGSPLTSGIQRFVVQVRPRYAEN
jgi:hypothetical protein